MAVAWEELSRWRTGLVRWWCCGRGRADEAGGAAAAAPPPAAADELVGGGAETSCMSGSAFLPARMEWRSVMVGALSSASISRIPDTMLPVRGGGAGVRGVGSSQ